MESEPTSASSSITSPSIATPSVASPLSPLLPLPLPSVASLSDASSSSGAAAAASDAAPDAAPAGAKKRRVALLRVRKRELRQVITLHGLNKWFVKRYKDRMETFNEGY